MTSTGVGAVKVLAPRICEPDTLKVSSLTTGSGAAWAAPAGAAVWAGRVATKAIQAKATGMMAGVFIKTGTFPKARPQAPPPG
jgi:hypothetical protein